MRIGNSGALIGLVLLGAAIAAVFIGVLEKRFASGQIYPHYSTQRSDPLGTRALYASLSELEDLEVSRNRRNLMTTDLLDQDSALWLCGLSPQALAGLRTTEDSPFVEAIEERGARLIITIAPQRIPGARDPGSEGPDSEPDQAEGDFMAPGISVKEWLGVEIEIPEKIQRPGGGWELEQGTPPETRPLPASLPRWQSPLRFSHLDPAWKTVASIDGRAVVIERRLGEGSVAVTTDSYFASNEGLWKNPQPGFLIWLTGGKSRLTFDETIHGSLESGGVMKVIRRYRLHGFFYGIFVFLVLFAWRSASSLAPGNETLERGLTSPGDTPSVTGEETSSGLIRLLRRNVPPKRLLQTCLETWRLGAGHRRTGENEEQRRAIDGIAAAHRRSPRAPSAAEAYREISEVIAHPDRYRKPNRP